MDPQLVSIVYIYYAPKACSLSHSTTYYLLQAVVCPLINRYYMTVYCHCENMIDTVM